MFNSHLSEDADCSPITYLSNELLNAIIDHLSLEDLLVCSQINTKWFNIVRENLQRTQSHALVRDEEGCQDFNCGRNRRGLILCEDLCHRLSESKLARLESLYICGNAFHLESLQHLLSQSVNLKELTIQTTTPLNISHLELLLCEARALRCICLLMGEASEQQREQMMDFFTSCQHFYEEIVIEVSLRQEKEVIYICSDKTEINSHLQRGYSKVYIGHVQPALVKNILSSSRIKELTLVSESSTDEMLEMIGGTIERLSLHSLSFENEAWRRFFNKISSSGLTDLRVSHCNNITEEELKQLQPLKSLDVDFISCPKISMHEEFLEYCLSHVTQLRVCFQYSSDIMYSFLSLLRSSHSRVTESIVLDILRVNYCSEDVSNHLVEFKSSLENLSQSPQIRVAEVFTLIRQNV